MPWQVERLQKVMYGPMHVGQLRSEPFVGELIARGVREVPPDPCGVRRKHLVKAVTVVVINVDDLLLLNEKNTTGMIFSAQYTRCPSNTYHFYS